MAAEFMSKPSIKKYEDESDDDGEDLWDDTLLIQAWDKSWNIMKEAVDNRLKVPTIGNGNKGKFEKEKNLKKKQKEERIANDFKWKVGHICTAVWDGDGYEYTAKILDVNRDTHTCEVLFIDYGNSEIVDMDKIKAIELTFPSNDSSQEDISEDQNFVETVYLTGGNVNGSSSSSSSSMIKYEKQKTPLFSSRGATTPLRNQNQRRSTRLQNMAKQPTERDLVISSDGAYSRSHNSFSEPADPPYDDLEDNFQNFQTPINGKGGSSHNGFPDFPFNLLSGGQEGPEKEALASMLISWYMTGYHTGYYHGIRQKARGQGDGPADKQPLPPKSNKKCATKKR